MEKINVAELLKDCPKGMELDCTIFDGVKFDGIEAGIYPIRITIPHVGVMNLNKFGEHFMFTKNTKCVIFPKGKTTWEGFHRPFKDGDIVAVTMYPEGTWIGIFKQYEKTSFEAHCSLNTIGEYYIGSKNHSLKGVHLATEKEKEKLFKAIKDNGYRWNAETKTLEKLPKFKVGDRIKLNNCSSIYTITDLLEDRYRATVHSYDLYEIKFERQDAYELVPNKFDINTLKPFDKVLVRGDVGQKWTHDFFGFMDKDKGFPFVCVGHYVIQCIPYEGNEHLLGKTTDCDEYFKTWK